MYLITINRKRGHECGREHGGHMGEFGGMKGKGERM